jgi:hypothetical protein
VTIRRTILLPPLVSSSDYTWDAVEQFYWCFAEVNVGILCASIPALRPLFMRYIPSFLAHSRDKSSSDKNAHLDMHNSVVESNKRRRQMQVEAVQVPSRGTGSPLVGNDSILADDEESLWPAQPKQVTRRGDRDGTTSTTWTGKGDPDGADYFRDWHLDNPHSVKTISASPRSSQVRQSGIVVTREATILYGNTSKQNDDWV